MTQSSAEPLRAPSLRLLLSESRVIAEVGRYLLRGLDLGGLPRGHGEPVLVIPGLGTGDQHTQPLRKALARLGYDVHGWDAGRNLGMRAALKERLNATLRRLHRQHGQKVTLIGWSLGGVFAREMARHNPELVRRVFTLGSPFNGHPHANNLVTLFSLVTRTPKSVDLEGFRRRALPPPGVPCTAIYSRSDGIIAWRCCLEDEGPSTENVEVRGSHFGLPVNREVLRAIAERLAR
jgi:pimeloyl-ACP methyl ester carboxylesterase